jgi:hypothetical protein
MSEQIPLGDEGDRPIIIQGGSSVDIFVPDNFIEQPVTNRQKDFKNDNVSLASLQIDEGTPIPLNKDSKITINYK